MKNSRLKTLLIGLIAGVAYAFLVMLFVTYLHQNVSITYIFILPVVLGAIPVLFSTKEQLQSYKAYLLLPWGITLTFFFLAWGLGYDGMICLMVIVAPFLLLGTLGAFIYRLIKLKNTGNGNKLYFSLLAPFIFLAVESTMEPADQIYTVNTSMMVQADQQTVWNNIKNVRNIQSSEIKPHFIHFIGIPRPLNGELDKEAIGGIRHITWEKGIKFEERITSWNQSQGFSYDIVVDPHSIPPTTLDEHVMIGGKYFDVLMGSYQVESISATTQKITLSCTYRVTTGLQFYSKVWADFMLNDFNEMILEVIKSRSENEKN